MGRKPQSCGDDGRERGGAVMKDENLRPHTRCEVRSTRWNVLIGQTSPLSQEERFTQCDSLRSSSRHGIRGQV
jgi:hypothetical protein